jgi:uncharacterized protein (TIGR02284 family)
MVDRSLEHFLNDLIRMNINSEKAYREAANLLDDPEIAQQFREYASVRHQFVMQLQEMMSVVGGQPAHDEKIVDSLDRAITKYGIEQKEHPDPAILDAFIDGGNDVLAVYEHALEQDYPTPLPQILQEQYNLIQQAQDYIKSKR